MKIGRKLTPESPEEMHLVHLALENPTRRKMLILAVDGPISVGEMEGAFGPNMLKYQLHRLELAGLIDIKDGIITPTESGKAYGDLVKSQAEKGGAGKV